jgi:CSLREA domain-containing protein
MKPRAANSRFSRKPSPRSRRLSVKRLASRKWLTPSLSVLVALLFAGLAGLRHAEFSRSVSAQQGKPVPLEYVVNSTADYTDNVGPDTVCADTLGRCTLRAAIEASNSHPPGDSISFFETVEVEIDLTIGRVI